MSSATFLGGRPEASFKETWRATHFVTKNFRDTVAEKEGFLATYSLVSSWKSLLGHELLTFCDGPALRPFSSAGLWNEYAPEKLFVAERQFACVCPTFYHLCFSEFFRNPAENFAGLRSGNFSPKGGSRYI